MRLLPLAVLLVILPPVLHAQAPAPRSSPAPESAPQTLPVRRVVLYKTGVGYFEHIGQVRDRQDIAIRFTSAQLNDALKSLTAIDLGQGRIAGISYDSVAPLEQRLGALRLPLGETTTSAGMLSALRGARVEVSAGGSVTTGRLLGIEQTTRGSGADRVVQPGFSIVSDGGEVRSFDLGPGVAVRVVDRDLRQDIGRYLDVVSSMRDRDARTMVVSTEGTGARSLVVSYVSEVPIWKSTYRLVLPAGSGTPLLQGWAIVDNTIGEDWTGVELSLVAGAPQSFVQDISKPYYGRRPVVPVGSTSGVVQTAPQMHDATLLRGRASLGGTVRDNAGVPLPGVAVRITPQGIVGVPTPLIATTDTNGAFDVAVPDGAYRIDATLAGFSPASVPVVNVTADGATRIDLPMTAGSATEAVKVTSRPVRIGGNVRALEGNVPGGVMGGVVSGLPGEPPPPAPGAVAYGQLAQQDAGTTGAVLGDLFEYRIARPVTLAKDQSALVPIVSAPVTVEKVALWNQASAGGRPLRAVWLQNTSGLTLDGGSMTIVDGNAFAGEGLVQPLKPGERRLISYGTELGVLVRARPEGSPVRVARVRAKDGVLVRESEARATWIYTARNENDSPATLVIEHRARAGWKVDAGQNPVESSAGADRFRVTVPAHQEATLTVRETQALATTVSFEELSDAWISESVSGGIAAADIQRALGPVLEKRAAVRELYRQIAALQNEQRSITEDQARLRDNMKALKGSAEERSLLQRYTRQLDAQETRLDAIRSELDERMRASEAAQRDLSLAIAALAFDITPPAAR